MADYIREQIDTQTSTESRPPTVEPLEQLKQLAELRDAGIVTTEEFEAKKTELLDRL